MKTGSIGGSFERQSHGVLASYINAQASLRVVDTTELTGLVAMLV